MNILICSSSRNEIDEKYINLAKEVSSEISSLGHNLVFGAASTGMMGETIKHFNTIYSYTVKKYEKDLKNINSTQEFIEENTFDRSKNMYKQSDIIIFLPGGTGTLSELFSMLEENRSIDNPKELIIYNYDNFYDNILNTINNLIDNNFNSNNIKDYFKVVNNTNDLLEIIKR